MQVYLQGMEGGEGDVVLLRIPARDPVRAARFYAALFAWSLGAPGAGGVAFHTPGGMRGVFAAGEPSTAGPEIYVGVADVHRAVKRAQALGGAAIVRPGPVADGGRRAVILDTEGNRVGLWEPERAGEAPPEAIPVV